ncbi:MAG: archease [Acidobacteriia bacterium]|nr:archease [Terriglobia bacterium]MBZ5728748.1 archease [Terriglobia bacterium]
MTFELLEHPADIGFRARGATLAELFGNCAHALVSIILDPSGIELVRPVPLQAVGGDYESLLVNWLNEVLYAVDGLRMALGAFEISRLEETRIECLARGEPRDPARHPGKLVVKAVTYHQLKVAHAAGGWLAEVYLDI